jgi:hypothetical protein
MAVVGAFLRHSDAVWDWCMSQHAHHAGGRDTSNIEPALAEARSSLRELRLLVDTDEELRGSSEFSDALIHFWVIARAAMPDGNSMSAQRDEVIRRREEAMQELRRLVRPSANPTADQSGAVAG